MIDGRRALSALAAACLCAGLGACATVTRGLDEAWTVTTEPSGAAVKTTAGFSCEQTPCSFKMRRTADFDVTITKPGFMPITKHVSHGLAEAGAAGFLGNALVGGIIGAGVDVATGATQELKPNPLAVKLEPAAKPGEPASKPEEKVAAN